MMDDWLKLKSEFKSHVRFKNVTSITSRFKRRTADRSDCNELKISNEIKNEIRNKPIKSAIKREKCGEDEESPQCDRSAKCSNDEQRVKIDAANGVTNRGSNEAKDEVKNGAFNESNNESNKESKNESNKESNNESNQDKRLNAKCSKSVRFLEAEKRPGDLLVKCDHYLLMLLCDSMKQSNEIL